MAEMDFDAYEASEGPAPAGLMSRVMNWVGAGSSVVLVMGLGVWAYQLAMRDVTDVPVIQALEGPARVQPENPGGQLAEHQGLAVNNLQAAGEAEGPTPQIILAPEPIDLTQEDVILTVPPEATSELQETQVSLVTETAPEEVDPNAQAAALAEQLAEGIEPLEAPSVDQSAAVEVAVAAALAPAQSGIDPAIPGVKRSPRPGLRPNVDLASLHNSAAVASAAAAVSSIDVDPASVVAGTRLVQLGAFDDVETAKAEWDKIAARFDEYLDGKGRLIQEASSGGRKFYRLRAVGFDDLNASRRFCAVLVAANAACIPVLAR